MRESDAGACSQLQAAKLASSASLEHRCRGAMHAPEVARISGSWQHASGAGNASSLPSHRAAAPKPTCHAPAGAALMQPQPGPAAAQAAAGASHLVRSVRHQAACILGWPAFQGAGACSQQSHHGGLARSALDDPTPHSFPAACGAGQECGGQGQQLGQPVQHNLRSMREAQRAGVSGPEPEPAMSPGACAHLHGWGYASRPVQTCTGMLERCPVMPKLPCVPPWLSGSPDLCTRKSHVLGVLKMEVTSRVLCRG